LTYRNADRQGAAAVAADSFVEVGADDSLGNLSVMQLEADSVDIDPASVMFF
jgi:hypothetical protein